MTNIRVDSRWRRWWRRLKGGGRTTAITIWLAQGPILLIAAFGYGLEAFLWLLAFFFGCDMYWLYRNWETMIRQPIDMIHTMLFGKPLRKEYWEPGEWAALKARFRWYRPWHKEFWDLRKPKQRTPTEPDNRSEVPHEKKRYT